MFCFQYFTESVAKVNLKSVTESNIVVIINALTQTVLNCGEIGNDLANTKVCAD